MKNQVTSPVLATSIPTIFNYDEKIVRTITHEDNSLWFVAKDVFSVLEIPWNGKTSLVKIPDAWRGVSKFYTPQKNQSGKEYSIGQELITINEPAVYKLAFRSSKPEADKFTNWVASEVLPSIRKTGAYVIPVQELLPETIIPAEQHELSAVVHAKAAATVNVGKARAEIWSRFKNKFKVARYDQIPRSMIQQALKYVSEMEVKGVKLLPTTAPAHVEPLEVGLLKIKIEHLEAKNGANQMLIESLQHDRAMFKELYQETREQVRDSFALIRDLTRR